VCTGAEPTHAAPCEAPLLRKFGLSFGCDVSVRSSVQTLGEGEGSSKTTRRGVENAIFLGGKSVAVFLGNRRFHWQKIA